MISPVLFTCTGDTCGWIAAIVALFAAGTYGVPIKETMYQITDLNPFIFQTYKVVVFLIVSIISVITLHVPIRMTFYYGTLSGFLWVCGGTGGIIAVRYAGLATAVGTWASIMICVNFTWGILVFHEPVANMYYTVTAFALLTLGLVGMSTFADPSYGVSTSTNVTTAGTNPSSINPDDDNVKCKKDLELVVASNRGSNNNTNFITHIRSRSMSDDDEFDEESENTMTINLLKQRRIGGGVATTTNANTNNNTDEEAGYESDSLSSGQSTLGVSQSSCTTTTSSLQSNHYNPETHVRLFGSTNYCIVTKRTAGILAALFNGFMSGSSLIPMHFAKRQGGWGGLNYLISFSVGSVISCASIWFIYYITLVIGTITQQRKVKKLSHQTTIPTSNSCSSSSNNNNGSTITTTNDETSISFMYHLQQAASKMPDIYWKQLWKTGLAAGLLNAIGMVCSVLAVTYLGQGVGNSVIQCKIIISGMWGIYYYKEIHNTNSIRKWFISASISVIGIIWLSRERIRALSQAK